jgi:serine/threonine protein kinase
MQSKGCTHADIKPANILTSSSSASAPPAPKTVYSDFSSSTLQTLSTEASPSPLGAGTWDYLDPSLLSSATPATPSAATDLWSLAITLLYLIVGASPFDALKSNTFQQREMIKQGAPLACVAYGDEGIKNMRRLRALEGALGFSLVDWLGRVFVKDVKKRVGLDAWRDELVRGIKGGI